MKTKSPTVSSLSRSSGVVNNEATDVECTTRNNSDSKRSSAFPAKASTLGKKQELQSEVLLLKADETCRILGGIRPRTLDRLCQRGLLKPVPLIRHKMYALADVQSLVEQLRSWKS